MDQPPRPAVAVSIDGRIAEDKTCRECGYNLRGLKTDGICPECGGEVAASLLGHELLYASPPWLKTITRGFRYMRNALLLGLAVVLVSLLGVAAGKSLGALLETAGISNAERWIETLAALTAILVFLALGVAALYSIVGFVMATRVEPRVRFDEGFSARRAARCFTFLTIVFAGLSRYAHHILPQSRFGDLAALLLSPAMTISALLAAEAFVRHAVALLERTAETHILKEAHDTKVIARAALILAGVVALAQGIATKANTPGNPASSFQHVIHVVDGCGSCLRFLLSLGLLYVIWTTGTALQRIVRSAETTPNGTTDSTTHES